MPPTVYTDRAIKATTDLIDFYKDKIAELEMFKEDLKAGKVEGGDRCVFDKYSVNRRSSEDKRVTYWGNRPDLSYDYYGNEDFSLRYDDKYSWEPIGVCDVSVLDFAVIINKIMGENDDPDVVYGETDSENSNGETDSEDS